MKELFMIGVGAAFINNVVLSQFLGICAFLGVSKKTGTAAGMGAAVVFVITLSSLITGILYRYVQEKCPELTAQAEEAMDNIDYYMKCLNAHSLLVSLKILLDSLWESGEDKSSDAGSIMQQVEQIHKYIERSYHENITLTALAEQYHMDASYLSRTFSQKYGETIIAFLTRIRMEKAAELMKNQDKKLETISFLVGYDDYNYFSRVFRKKVGCSPREYRNKFTQL